MTTRRRRRRRSHNGRLPPIGPIEPLILEPPHTGPRYAEHLWDPIYKVNLLIARCVLGKLDAELRQVTTTALADEIQRKLQIGEHSMGHTMGYCDDAGNHVVLVWIKPTAPIGVIAHEAFHAAFYVLEQKGLRVTPDSEEAVAYYIQWIAGEIGKLGLLMGVE